MMCMFSCIKPAELFSSVPLLRFHHQCRKVSVYQFYSSSFILDYPRFSSDINSLLCEVLISQSLCLVRLFATPWTVVQQVPLSMGFSRQEYWSGLPFPSLGDLPDPGIEPRSPALQADSFSSEPSGKHYVKTYFDHDWNGRDSILQVPRAISN